MDWIDALFSLVWEIAWFFNKLSGEARDIPFVGNAISKRLYSIYEAIFDLLTPIAHFGDWAVDTADKIATFLNAKGILKLLQTWLDYATAAWEWIQDADTIILAIVIELWGEISETVLGWIDGAKTWAKDLIDAVAKNLATLRSAWNDFWTTTWPEMLKSLNKLASDWAAFLADILPTLATWTGVAKLIESTLKTWFPFYDDLVGLWDGMAAFFTDPLGWLEDKFTGWFLGEK